MSQRSQQLLDVQRLDAEIGRLTRQLQQVETALGDRLQQRAAVYAIQQAETAMQARQRELREQELDLATLEARIKEHEERLYSGKGNPRDLQLLQGDIAHDRERKGALEEQVLSAMDASEAARKEVARVKGATERVLGVAATRLEQVGAERTQLQAQIERDTARRAQLVAGIDATSLAQYERLRQRTSDGVAVVTVTQGRCEGCRTTLPSVEVQRARGTEGLVFCSVCGRILHVPFS
ncbi:MAG: C4-type zinc ribbon domain-containing protein [Chloroflexota bacterium]|nr:C4-type zinc ribbon domain-containing protein [Chloroflexota bacterium]